MNSWIKSTVSIIIAAIVLGISWKYYYYFFNPHAPCIQVCGLNQDQHCKAVINAHIIFSDSYKINDFSVWLDDKALAENVSVNNAEVKYPLSIDTASLAQGAHTLKLQALNNIYRPQRISSTLSFYVDNSPLEVALIRMPKDLKVMQGRTIHLSLHLNKKVQSAIVHVFNRSFRAIKEGKHSLIYEVFIPVNCEEIIGNYQMQIEVIDRVGNRQTLNKNFEVTDGLFKNQQKISVDGAKLQQESSYKTERQFEESVQSLSDASRYKKLWQGSFYSPIDIASISTEYGTVRTTQERGRYMHKAVDVVSKPRSVVWATQDGLVVLKDRFAHSGNTIVIDHGCGILSLFFHLDSFAEILVGQPIKRGNPIGTLGQTGYAKGYHLHWEMRIGNQHVDPMQWIDPYF